MVSTCVGEEGLDIGEVDLIICFDAHKSPVRLVQRMGRTGRRRSGRIVVIVAEGREEQVCSHGGRRERYVCSHGRRERYVCSHGRRERYVCSHGGRRERCM